MWSLTWAREFPGPGERQSTGGALISATQRLARGLLFCEGTAVQGGCYSCDSVTLPNLGRRAPHRSHAVCAGFRRCGAVRLFRVRHSVGLGLGACLVQAVGVCALARAVARLPRCFAGSRDAHAWRGRLPVSGATPLVRAQCHPTLRTSRLPLILKE